MFGARAGRAAAEYAASAGATPAGRAGARRRTSSAGSSTTCSARTTGSERIADDPRRDADDDGGRAPASTAPATSLRQGRPTTLRELQERVARRRRSTTPAGRSTPSCVAALELAYMLDIAECIVHVGAAARGVARRAPAHRLPGARRRAVPRALAGPPQRRRLVAGRVPAGDDHPLAAGRAGLREVAAHGGPHHAAGRAVPAGEGRRSPRSQEYEVPLREGLGRSSTGSTTSRTELDGTLSYRWSCRMGICGSCGMNVDGEPKLTCATFLADYAPGPGPRRAAAPTSRSSATSSSTSATSCASCRGSSRGSSATRRSRCREGEYLQTPEELDEYKQFSMCINCMLCYAACPVYGLDPTFIGPAAIALASATTSTPATRARASGSTCSSSTRASGAARSSASARKVCPKHVDPAGAIQRYKLKAAQESVKAFLLPRGAR